MPIQTGTAPETIELRPIGTEMILPLESSPRGAVYIFRVKGHWNPADFAAAPTHEYLEPIGEVVNGEKRYWDGRRVLIEDYQI